MSAIDEDDAKVAAATSIQKDGLKSRSCLYRFFVETRELRSPMKHKVSANGYLLSTAAVWFFAAR
jgi:hypothetical protein